jgi:hypothetical protein
VAFLYRVLFLMANSRLAAHHEVSWRSQRTYTQEPAALLMNFEKTILNNEEGTVQWKP